MSRGPDAGTLLVRAIETESRRAGHAVTIAAADWTRWASATFTGARHEITIEADESAAFVAWLAALPESDLSARTLFVADLTIAGVRRAAGRVTARIEALTVEV